MVIPVLEYSETVWDPHLQKDILVLEKLKSHAAHFINLIYNNADFDWYDLAHR